MHRASLGTRHARPMIAALALAIAAGCGSDEGPTVEPVAEGDAGPLLLSNPVTPESASDGLASLTSGIVYAALPPGSAPDAKSVTITNRSTGARTEVTLAFGGFDPIPLPATAGDSLEFRYKLGGGGDRLAGAKVPPRRPPSIVRTEPAVGRRDVPLNARYAIVFSEPLRASSVDPSAMRITRAGIPVPGTLVFADSSRLAVVFTPAAPLLPGTEHAMVVPSSVADADGETLGTTRVLRFTTSDPGSIHRDEGPKPTPTGFNATFEGITPSSYSNDRTELILRGDGVFGMRYFAPDPAAGDFTYYGTYAMSDTAISLLFDANAGSWTGRATPRGDSLAVEFNFDANMSGFEHDVFVRRPLGGTAPPETRGTLRVTVGASGDGVPAYVPGLLSGSAIRSVLRDGPATDHPALKVGENELSVSPGTYRLALQPPGNCQAGSPVEVTVAPGGTASAAMSVTCQQPGWLTVGFTVTTSRQPTLTSIIYICAVDSTFCRDVWPQSNPARVRLPLGTYRVFFMGYPNCRSVPEDGALVMLGPQEAPPITLNVACGP